MIDSGVALEASQFHNMTHHPLPPPAKHITITPEDQKSEEENKPPVHDISPPSPISPPKRSPKNTMSEPPQHLFSLVAQLRDARLELEAKSARVKDLEDMLRREKEAREMAEAQLEMTSHKPTDELRGEGFEDQDGDDIPDDVSVAGSETTVVGSSHHNDGHSQSQESDEHSATIAVAAANAAAEAAAKWQKKVEGMMAELQSAKEEIESYKKRVKTAEEEGAQSRRTLMEMVAKIRADEEKRQRKEMKETSVQTERKNADGSLRGKPVMISCGVQAAAEGDAEDVSDVFPGAIANGTVRPVNGALILGGGGKQFQQNMQRGAEQEQLQRLSTELMKNATGKRSMMKESVPYVSIVGVVVIGVSIMAILNNWQKGER